MKIKVIRDLNLADYSAECINVIPFGSFQEINFKRQMDGSSTDLVYAGRLSKKLGGLTFLGAETDNCGIKRRSVFIFEQGKLISICDQNRQTDKFSPAFGYKTFLFCGKKFGVLVDNDIYDTDAVKTLINSDCNAIINLYADFSARKAQISAEFYSFVFGVDFVLVAPNCNYAYLANGSLLKQSDLKEFELPCEKKYREIRIKKRGY